MKTGTSPYFLNAITLSSFIGWIYRENIRKYFLNVSKGSADNLSYLMNFIFGSDSPDIQYSGGIGCYGIHLNKEEKSINFI